MNLPGNPTELWRQLPDEPDLWHGEHGVLINTAALLEREAFFEVTRIAAAEFGPSETPEFRL